VSHEVSDGIADIRKACVHPIACVEQYEHIRAGGPGPIVHQPEQPAAFRKGCDLLLDAVFEDTYIFGFNPLMWLPFLSVTLKVSTTMLTSAR
jgi:hypothetical protein